MRSAIAALFLLLAGVAAAQGGAEAGTWSSYRDFWFEFDSARLDPGDAVKIADVASYVRGNPGHRIGIDGVSGSGDDELHAQRIGAVRGALIRAGVPAQRIEVGRYGDERFRRARRIEVLVGRQ